MLVDWPRISTTAACMHAIAMPEGDSTLYQLRDIVESMHVGCTPCGDCELCTFGYKPCRCNLVSVQFVPAAASCLINW